MKALVIYDSVFGNTEKIAEAVGKGIGGTDTRVLRIAGIDREAVAAAELLVVGSPTRKFTAMPSVKKFLKQIDKEELAGKAAAAFDTRVSVQEVNSSVLNFLVRLFGYAAEPIAKLLAAKSAKLVVPSEGFIVTGTEGPLKENELARAEEWGKRIASACQTGSVGAFRKAT